MNRQNTLRIFRFVLCQQYHAHAGYYADGTCASNLKASFAETFFGNYTNVLVPYTFIPLPKNSIIVGLMLVVVTAIAASVGFIVGAGATLSTLLAVYLGYKLLRLILRVVRLVFSLIFSVISIIVLILILSFLIF